MPTEMELTLEQTQQGVSYEVSVFTMKMEILLEPTSNKLMVEHAEYDESNTYVLERFNTTAGNPVKKILLKLNLSDHRLCKMVVEVPDSSWLTRSITTCSYPTDKHKVIMKAQITSILQKSSVQTRRMTQNTNEQGFISAVYKGKTHKHLHTCLFSCFLSQEEQKRISKALSDLAWVEAMQEELL
ncbi:hypothetical protein Tco_1524081 [Tanacetum coccineum]